jgi:phage FluMu gp28-like protein
MTEQFVRDVAFFARLYSLAAGDVFEDQEVFMEGDERKSVTVYRIRFDSGHMVTGLPSHPRVIRSKQGKVVIDEAAFVDNLEEFLKAALALLIWGAVIRVISTHNGEDNPFNQLIQDIRAGKRPGAVVHRCPFMKAVEEGLYHRICRKQGKKWTPEGEKAFIKETYDIYGDDAAEELDVVPSSGSGFYLNRNMIEAVMDPSIPVIRWEPPAKDFVDWPKSRAVREVRDWCAVEIDPILVRLDQTLKSYFGQDFGRSGDLSVIHPGQETLGLDLITPFILELRNCPFRTQRQILFYILDRLPRFQGGAMDARGNGQALAEETRQEYGPDRILEVMPTESWYRESMPRLKARFEDRTWNLPKDGLILDDYRALKLVRGVPRVPETRTMDAKGGKRHGDAAVAGDMLVYAHDTLDVGEPFEALTAGINHSKQLFRGY